MDGTTSRWESSDIHVQNGGPWYIQQAGFFTFNSAPTNLGAVLPPGAPLDASQWNLAPLNPLARDFQVNFTEGDWTIDIRDPTTRCGSETTGRWGRSSR